MVVIFDKEYLRELYEFGKTSDKKHRFQPDIVKRYIKCVKFLIASDSVEILKQINSLNYEVLKGDKEGISSIRVNNKYRLEFFVREYREESIITICNILELSNHYQ
ncbi:MAG: type II toxin-antitoxin system RelE/ParE family toxin [Bacteroidales bacterium]|nr:type II toxin-antitoxin system RelE/ParE family toxin [Bacteroidales bacterium]